ncbi:MAG: hypothetical protein GDA53_10925 [Rhodobacteraceae bacterium]|nr:hypothetical protein [Paracoccaceae bacterium]
MPDTCILRLNFETLKEKSDRDKDGRPDSNEDGYAVLRWKDAANTTPEEDASITLNVTWQQLENAIEENGASHIFDFG